MTIRDVAKRAGVSEATVSLVLNGHEGRVSEMTRQKVLQAVEELDYTPNSIARSLAGRTTWTIGLVVSDVLRTPYPSVIKGVEAAAMRLGYQVMLANLNDDSARLVRATDVYISNRVDGIIFALSSRRHPQLPVDRLMRQNIPFALVNHSVDVQDIPTVLIDNQSGTKALTRQLVELGHRRIGCIHLPLEGASTVSAAIERLAGFKAALADMGIELDPALIREGAWGEVHGEAVGYRSAYELLTMNERPTALVCCNDYLAIGAIRACEDLGLSVPQDVAIVGHDNVAGSAYVRPTLTTVEQPMTEAGRLAMHMLASIIQQRSGGRLSTNLIASGDSYSMFDSPDGVEAGGGSSDEFTVKLPCSLVIRSSSGHFPRQ